MDWNVKGREDMTEIFNLLHLEAGILCRPAKTF